jgi:hypothetical protein
MRQVAILKDALVIAWKSLSRLTDPMSLDDDPMPVWVSFSNPGPPQFEFAIVLALSTPSFERIVLNEEMQLNTPEFFKLVNDRLRAFDEIAYDSLRCDNVDEVLKNCFLEDLAPLFQSMERIAADPNMWSASLKRNDYVVEGLQQKCDEQQREFQDCGSAEHGYNISNPRFLPLSMRLHPFDPSKGFASQFRLFFYEGSLVAATQVSTWSFLEEIFELRNSVMNALATFATSSSTKSLISNVQRAAEAVGTTTESHPSAATFPSSKKLDLNWSKAPTEKEKLRVAKFYIPDESDVYLETPTFSQRQYNYDDYMTIGGQIGRPGKYKFIQKLSSFMTTYIKFKKAGKPKQAAAVVRPEPPSGYMYNDAIFDLSLGKSTCPPEVVPPPLEVLVPLLL